MENKYGEKELGRHIRSLRPRGAVSTMGRSIHTTKSKHDVEPKKLPPRRKLSQVFHEVA